MALVMKKKVAAPAVGVVTKVPKDGVVEETQEVVKQVVSDQPLATVSVSMGITKNLGNYESVKVSVGITMPCKSDEASIDAAYLEAKGWVDMRVEAINSEITQELG